MERILVWKEGSLAGKLRRDVANGIIESGRGKLVREKDGTTILYINFKLKEEV